MSSTLQTHAPAKSRSHTIELLLLAAPMIGMTVSRMLMGFIDFVMVSELGTAAQAAISPATLLLFAVGCVGMGVAQCVQTFVSQADGRNEPQRCGSYAWQAFYIAAAWTLLTLPATLTTDMWYGWLGRQFDHPPEVLDQEIAYLRIGLWCIGPMIICMGLENFFHGIRRPRVGLVAILVSLVVNAVGNYLLIFGEFGFPELGIAGAAIATLIGWTVRGLILFASMLKPEFDQRYVTRSLAAMRPDPRKLLDLARIGGPTAAQWIIDIGAWVVFMQAIMPPYGETAMAASNIVVQYMHLCFMPALGIGLALTSQVGFAIGAGRPDEAVHRVAVGRNVILAYMGVAAVFLVIARYWLTELLTDDPAVVLAGAQITIWAALFQLSDGLCITYSFGLRGAGDTRAPAVLFAICCWFIFIGGGLAMAKWWPSWGVHGPWLMCTLYIVVLGFLLWWRFASGAWRSIRLFDDKVPHEAGEFEGSRTRGFPTVEQNPESAATVGLTPE